MTDKTNNKLNDKNSFSGLKPVHKAACIALVATAALIAVCLVTDGMGVLGGGVRTILRGLFSWGSLIIPIAMISQAVGFAEDLESKRFAKRSIFALVCATLISCIEYAIVSWNEFTFSPIDAFTDMNGGGFIGNLIGYALTVAVSPLGTIIIAVMALAIYTVFFFAEKAGSLGQAALNFVASIKNAINFAKDKHSAYVKKKRQIKEDADQHQREVSSEELIDDEFFKAKGEASDVKIKQLGIEENASTHGLSPLYDPEKRIIEEPVIVEEEPEVRRKRSADKPLNLSYGIESDTIVVEEVEKKPLSNRSAFGLDDSADRVFTRDFDPFDFATSEKKAAKYASKVSGNSAVTEEIDEMTLYQMRADHEPDERERRLMELERKKQEWLKKRQANQPASAPTPSTIETVKPSPVHTEPAPAPQPVTPAPVVEEPVVSATPITPVSGYTPTAPTVPQRPIKTVEFTISKSPEATFTPPAVSKPTSTTVEKPTRTEHSDEDIAKIISQRVADATPGYIRSANDLKTYTKVSANGDDELYRQLEGIHSEPTTQVKPQEEIIENNISVQADPIVENTQSVDKNTEQYHAVEDISQSHEFESIPESVEFTIGEDRSEPVQHTAQSVYQCAAELTSSMANESVATPEFKPYTPPTVTHTAPASEENVLKAERSMLPPTPEAIITEVAKEPEVSEPVVNVTTPKADVEEIDFIPVDETIAEESSDVITEQRSSDAETEEPLFVVVEESEEEEGSESDNEDDVEISFDDDENEDEEYDNDGSDASESEESFDEADEGEIPPEEQNPDVIKMRQMFPFLAPIGEQKTEESPEEARVEETVAETDTTEENDDVPFDGAVEVKPASVPTSLVPIEEKKEKKKKTDYSDYQFPSLDFLAKQEEGADENIQAEIQENADKLIETLASFGVTASIKGVDRGPRITRYEVVPAKGVKVSSILNLQDDIALNLAAGSIRMEAPIPGKSAVGIEIPNKKSSIVRLRDLLETPDFESNKSKTFVCIGRDVAGQPVFGDLAKMPHLLIAGATGMGKSVCINALLISVLYKARPDEVKLIMIDPKQVEFTMYNGIPHLLVPVVSDPKQAAGALMWAVEEMERRYNLLNPLCVRNIEAYNEKVTADPSLGEPMPKIIIVIDEFADLMLQVKDPVEQLVTRIAQKARAAGIHLVIGTQRPSVNVITGVIKANVPSRISCKVMSNVDSKTVLDSAGAEKLLDKGDALYAPAGSPKPHRLQCAFVADGEVENIMNYLKQNNDGSSYDSTVMEDIERAAQKCSKKGGGADRDDGDSGDISGEGYLNDRQFLDAVEIAVNTRKISTSLIQRKLSIGYGKAAKFIDIMEDMGIVGEANGQRPREVKLTPDEWREKLARATLD